MTSIGGQGGAITAPEKSAVSDVLSLAPTPKKGIVTRRKLRQTNLSERLGIIDSHLQEDAGTHTSIVTRRQLNKRRRRRKRVLIAVAIVLGLFPPVLAFYLIAWLVWRSRPKQQSMRRVRKSVRALEKNQTGVALKQLQEAHFLDPSNTDALYWLGLVLSSQHRYDEAEEALSLVADRVPGLPEVEGALADAYVALGEPDNAVYHAQRLLDVAPYSTKTLLTLADAFEASGKIDLAVSALEQAPIHKRVLNEDLMRVHYRLGILYESKGDRQQARHHFNRVYARDVTYKDVAERLNALGESE